VRPVVRLAPGLLILGSLAGCGSTVPEQVADEPTPSGSPRAWPSESEAAADSTPTLPPTSETPWAQASPGSKVARPTRTPAAPGLVTTRYAVTAIDEGGGAELCLGGVLTSLPPQCGGPELVGWTWADHDGDFEDVSGTKFGEFVVTGTFDGSSIEPTEIVPADEFDAPPYDDGVDPFASPCPEPEGGWRVIDPERTTDRTLDQAVSRARRIDGFGDIWVDQSINPANDEPGEQPGMNDPKKLILNLTFTHDLETAEAIVREIWGGALCVSRARMSDRDLEPIQEAVGDMPGFSSSSRGDGQVDLAVTYDDGSIQAWLDQEYGVGTVVVTSELVDVDS
jgi:hypothetical protein